MNENTTTIPMLNSIAPKFIANSTVGPLKLTDYIGKWLMFLSFSNSFCPVSTTELISLSNFDDEFKRRNCELLGITTDSAASHLAWLNDIEKNTGNNITFPIISDTDKYISTLYGMFPHNAQDNVLARNVYILDPNLKIKTILIYPVENGRNISELLRILDAIQSSFKENILTPANWIPGMAMLDNSLDNYQTLMDKITINTRTNLRRW